MPPRLAQPPAAASPADSDRAAAAQHIAVAISELQKGGKPRGEGTGKEKAIEKSAYNPKTPSPQVCGL